MNQHCVIFMLPPTWKGKSEKHHLIINCFLLIIHYNITCSNRWALSDGTAARRAWSESPFIAAYSFHLNRAGSGGNPAEHLDHFHHVPHLKTSQRGEDTRCWRLCKSTCSGTDLQVCCSVAAVGGAGLWSGCDAGPHAAAVRGVSRLLVGAAAALSLLVRHRRATHRWETDWWATIHQILI